jgi:hypothetical protein
MTRRVCLHFATFIGRFAFPVTGCCNQERRGLVVIGDMTRSGKNGVVVHLCEQYGSVTFAARPTCVSAFA